MLGFTRETEPTGRVTYYKRLSHLIVEAEKSKTIVDKLERRANGIVSVQKLEGLRPKKS